MVTARKALEKAGLDVELHEDWAPVIVSWALEMMCALGYLEGVRDSPGTKAWSYLDPSVVSLPGTSTAMSVEAGGPDERIYHGEMNEECLTVGMQRAAKWGKIEEVVQLFAQKFFRG